MSPFFDYRLLPVLVGALFVHWIVLSAPEARLRFLTALSIVLLVVWQPLFACTAIVLSLGIHHAFLDDKRSPARLWGWVAALVLSLVVLKHGGELARWLPPSASWAERYLLLPLGASYFVFRVIQYAADRHRGTLRNASAWHVLGFFFFFPCLPAGPLQSFQEFHGSRVADARSFASDGIRRLLWGYFKKLVVIELVWDASLEAFSRAFLDSGPAAFISAPRMALKVVGLSFLRAYLDLSAYTDIAVGLGALFGYRLPENFHRPLTQVSLTGFWRSWHATLGRWCRDQVFFPVLGVTRRPWVAAYAGMIAMGLWHDTSWNWLVWGIYHGTGLVAWAYFERRFSRSPVVKLAVARAAGVVATLLFVVLGFALTAVPRVSDGIILYAACVEGLYRTVAELPRWFLA